jgi:predicted protein tyrosine phosphatase
MGILGFMSEKKHPAVIVLGYSEAAMYLKQGGAKEVRGLIAIKGFGEHAAEAAVAHRLVLEFDDVKSIDESDPVSVWRGRMAQEEAKKNGMRVTPPTMEHARAVLEFAGDMEKEEGALLCHCRAGVSRSAAAALLCLARWMGPGEEERAAAELVRVRNCAFPHEGLVGFGDVLLGRGGRLVEAVRTVCWRR